MRPRDFDDPRTAGQQIGRLMAPYLDNILISARANMIRGTSQLRGYALGDEQRLLPPHNRLRHRLSELEPDKARSLKRLAHLRLSESTDMRDCGPKLLRDLLHWRRVAAPERVEHEQRAARPQEPRERARRGRDRRDMVVRERALQRASAEGSGGAARRTRTTSNVAPSSVAQASGAPSPVSSLAATARAWAAPSSAARSLKRSTCADCQGRRGGRRTPRTTPSLMSTPSTERTCGASSSATSPAAPLAGLRQG